MIPLWRLVRNPYARRVYESLSALGLTGSRMIEYEVALRDHFSGNGPAVHDAPRQVSFHTGHTTADWVQEMDLDFSLPVSFLEDEWVVVATLKEETIGRALVSAGQGPYVDTLDQQMVFDGAYLRRVYVHPEWRNSDIARQLISEALHSARHRLEVHTVSALIAPDNKPSQWAFEANGFEPVRRHDYVCVFGWEFRHVTNRDF